MCILNMMKTDIIWPQSEHIHHSQPGKTLQFQHEHCPQLIPIYHIKSIYFDLFCVYYFFWDANLS